MAATTPSHQIIAAVERVDQSPYRLTASASPTHDGIGSVRAGGGGSTPPAPTSSRSKRATVLLEARFWSKVEVKSPYDCWPWRAGLFSDGYGLFVRADNRAERAHRVAYELAYGPIPAGLTIDHLCRHHPCVNPAHLEAVTNKENILRGVSFSAVNARKTHCIHGHEFTVENTFITARGRRSCQACRLARQRARYRGRRST